MPGAAQKPSRTNFTKRWWSETQGCAPPLWNETFLPRLASLWTYVAIQHSLGPSAALLPSNTMQMVAECLAAGADPSAPLLSISADGGFLEQTALHVASSLGDALVVNGLLLAGAAVDAKARFAVCRALCGSIDSSEPCPCGHDEQWRAGSLH